MNIIEQHRTLVCLPPRQATRAISKFMQDHFDMYSQGKRPNSATHSTIIPEGFEDYDIIMTTRNPYERWLSFVAWSKAINGWDGDYEKLTDGFARQYEAHKMYDVKHWIRTEHIADDLLKIPFVAARKNELEKDINNFRTYNPYKSKDRPIVELQKHADKIYENCKWVFDKFGYDKNSYKTIKE